MDTKICGKCGIEKPVTDFVVDNRTKRPRNPCRPCRNASNREYLKQNPEAHSRQLDRYAQRRRARRRQIIDHYGGHCACCGESITEFLAIDHIDGCGKEKRAAQGNLMHWLWKNDLPTGFRVLCHNCNMAFGQWGKCPHDLDFESVYEAQK